MNHQFALRGGSTGGPHVPAVVLNHMPGSLRSRAVLATLTIRSWGNSKKDDGATRAAQQAAGAQADTGAYSKHLISPAALKPIKTHDGEIRGYFREHSVTWDKGRVLVPQVTLMDFLQHLRDLGAERDRLVSIFASEYAQHVKQAQADLGTMFDAKQYPDPTRIKDYFSCEVLAEPLPDAADFRLDLPPGDLENMRNTLEADLKRRLQAGHAMLWDRLGGALRKMADTLAIPLGSKNAQGNPVGQFHDTLVGNLSELCDLLPGLNLQEDPELDQVLKEVSATLASLDPETLRKDSGARATAADRAADILKRLPVAADQAETD